MKKYYVVWYVVAVLFMLVGAGLYPIIGPLKGLGVQLIGSVLILSVNKKGSGYYF